MTLGREFGAATDAYEAGRPEYPIESVAWMLEDTSGTVLDLGAGTGKLTRAVVALGRDTVAVDPDGAMLDRLVTELPGVPAHVGTAEVIPLPDASCGAVVLGQAWHWVDSERASAEVARVLVPGGTLGLIWNVRDEREPWVARLTEAMHASVAEELVNGPEGPVVTAPFGPLEETRRDWTRPMTRERILAMVRSRSYHIAADADGKAAIEARVAQVLDDVPDLARESEAPVPYVTVAYRTRHP